MNTDFQQNILEPIAGDPAQVQIHQLSNGLKVYLSVNKLEPRIHSNIAVRAGSKHDPEDCTGLAHYFEHMMFKGSSKMGSLDWEKEKVLLQKIENLYEAYRNTEDQEERRAIYKQIDATSVQAAQYAIPNEYDKIVSELGAKETNAYTWVEQTVYINNIPSNELQKWLELEAERFRYCSLRLFHTELETVYEEFNITQDSDPRKVSKTIQETLFPTHPYGTRTTIGEGKHIKAPSQKKIREFFSSYYVPNNMAIILSGDFDPKEALQWIEKYWGGFQAQTLPEFSFEEQPNLEENSYKEVWGQEADYVEIGWKLPGVNAKTIYLMELIKNILQNGQVGLVDWLLRDQKVLSANAYLYAFEDYSILRIQGHPRENQSLEELKELLEATVKKIENGDFEEWILEAVVNDIKLSRIKSCESNNNRVSNICQYFVWGLPWENYAQKLDKIKAFTKDDVVSFAKEHLSNGAAIVYKRNGNDPDVIKVDKPSISPIPLNKSESSDFAKQLLEDPSPRIETQFLDFLSTDNRVQLSNGIPFDYLPNELNNSFSTSLFWEVGKAHDKYMGIMTKLFNYGFTPKYSLKAFQDELFRHGLYLSASNKFKSTRININGLGESFEKGIELTSELMNNLQIADEAVENLKGDIFKSRLNALQNKQVILREAMAAMARYGSNNPFIDKLSEQEVLQLNASEISTRLQNMMQYPHEVFYYGNHPHGEVQNVVQKAFGSKSVQKSIPTAKSYTDIREQETQVHFLDFPIVQTEILFQSLGTDHFSLDEYIMAEWYNIYFGYGLSSIMFQEIREAKAFGYATYAYYSSPGEKDKPHILQAYLGTQPDKVNQAIPEIQKLLNDMPIVPNQMEQARQSILRNLESNRITRTAIHWTKKINRKLGYERDLRKDIYDKLSQVQLEDLIAFHQKHVKGRKYNILLMGNKKSLDMNFIKSLGDYREWDIPQLFGYSEEDCKRSLGKLKK